MFEKRTPPPGSRPGTLAIPADAMPPTIRVMDYGPDSLVESEIDDPEDLRAYFDSPTTAWVDVQGFGDEAVLRKIGEIFGLHPLTLEDATNVPQRAKSQAGPEYHLVVARVPVRGEDGQVEVPQVCFIVGPNWVLTFQDRRFGFFDAVRGRLRAGPGRPIRRLGASYLLYALLDVLVDLYFPLVEEISAELEDLEEALYADAPDVLPDLHRARRDLVVIRRVGWPQREALRFATTEPSEFLSDESRVFLRSTEQHIVQVMEAVDAARDNTTSLMDIYLSTLSQKTNDVMMVLTLMASIFIPLTFIAGIYGMNFDVMPELRFPFGYPVALGIMSVMAIGMLVYFRRRGWLGRRGGGSRREPD